MTIVSRFSRLRSSNCGFIATVLLLPMLGCSSLNRTVDPSSGNPASAGEASHGGGTLPTSDESLRKLLDGNARFVSGHLQHPERSPQRREDLAAGQHPFAVVLSCSDSRVPPEIVFDAGLGEIFVVRVAGNTADPQAVGSIEYGVEHLGAPLVVVLGHDHCGAVKAAISSVESKTEPAGHLPAVVDPIKPAVEKVLPQGGNVLEHAVSENVRQVVDQLKTSEPVLGEAVHAGHLKIVGAIYDLKTGQVTLQQ